MNNQFTSSRFDGRIVRNRKFPMQMRNQEYPHSHSHFTCNNYVMKKPSYNLSAVLVDMTQVYRCLNSMVTP